MGDWDRLIHHPDYEICLKGITMHVKDRVFSPDPSITYSSSILLNHMPDVKGKDALDMGCGSGIIGLYCAMRGAKKVVAADIDYRALENTRENFRGYNLENKVKIIRSDLFENIHEQFDYIFGNLPILDEIWNKDKHKIYRLSKRFILDCERYLNESGKAYLTWASFADVNPIREYCSISGLDVKEITEKKLGVTWHLFELSLKLKQENQKDY